MRFQVERPHEGVGDRHAGPIRVGVQDRFYGETCPGGGAANGRQEQLPGTQRRADAIAADEAEQTVLDRVPFGQGVMMPVSRSASYAVNAYVQGVYAIDRPLARAG